MATFVLVHGAWHGGWCWAALQSELRKAGHDSFAVTLTGLGERAHLLGPDVTPDTHVMDVVNTITYQELSDVILVGHSYGGNIISGVAGQIPEKLAGMVFLDALVPNASGESLMSRGSPERIAAFNKQIETGTLGVKPDFFHTWSDDEDTIAWLKSLCTPHPVRCLTEGVTLTGRESEVARKLYILAERNKPSIFWSEYEKVQSLPGWKFTTMPTKHDVMVEDPHGLSLILNEFAQ